MLVVSWLDGGIVCCESNGLPGWLMAVRQTDGLSMSGSIGVCADMHLGLSLDVVIFFFIFLLLLLSMLFMVAHVYLAVFMCVCE